MEIIHLSLNYNSLWINLQKIFYLQVADKFKFVYTHVISVRNDRKSQITNKDIYMAHKILTMLVIIIFPLIIGMEKPKNDISSVLKYTKHANEKMEERDITREEILRVLQLGIRSWENEDEGTERFTERKNKKNPLVVIINRNQDPNVIVTVYKENPSSKPEPRKFKAGRLREEAYLNEKREKKEKDLCREANRDSRN
jgi:hypothetical protein